MHKKLCRAPQFTVIITAGPCSFPEAFLSPYAWQKAAFEGTNVVTSIQSPIDHCKGQSQQPFLNVMKPTSNSWPNQQSNHHGKWPELFVTSMLKPSKFFKICKVTRNELIVGSLQDRIITVKIIRVLLWACWFAVNYIFALVHLTIHVKYSYG